MMERAELDGEPYGDLALMYDELVGDVAFDCWRENFERLSRRYELAFDVAADIACGTGQAARYLASRCVRVYAVDKSRRMLDVAMMERGRENIIYMRQDFTGLELPERVGLLTCNFDSLNYAANETVLRETLRRFAASLREGGYALFDVNTSRQLEVGGIPIVMVHRTEAGISIWESSWDGKTRTNTLRMTNMLRRTDGLYTMSEEWHREHCYGPEVVITALRDAGFERVDALDANGLSRPGDETRRIQFVARR